MTDAAAISAPYTSTTAAVASGRDIGTSEDAAGEGGEVVATFCSYNPPKWVVDLDNSNSNSNPITISDEGEAACISGHTSPACESGLLASVAAPQPKEASCSVIQQLLKEKKLSLLQAEGACLAIERHSWLLPAAASKRDNKGVRVRSGFFLGDGAGEFL